MIDTHSHLFAEEFTEDLPAVIERAKAAGVSKVLMPNIDDTTIEAMLSVCTASGILFSNDRISSYFC